VVTGATVTTCAFESLADPPLRVFLAVGQLRSQERGHGFERHAPLLAPLFYGSAPGQLGVRDDN
jgi:hypothetical protein